MKDFLVGTAILGGIVGVPLFISSVISNPAVHSSIPTPTIVYNTCYFNGIKKTSVRTCKEMTDAYEKIFCPAFADSWEDQDCEDFDDHTDAQETYEYSIICWNSDINDLDRDHDGIACESLLNE